MADDTSNWDLYNMWNSAKVQAGLDELTRTFTPAELVTLWDFLEYSLPESPLYHPAKAIALYTANSLTIDKALGLITRSEYRVSGGMQ